MMSSNTIGFTMKMFLVLLVLALAANRIRTDDQCGDELTCLQSTNLLLVEQQKLLNQQLHTMQEQFHQIQQMHDADRKIMAQQLEFAAQQAKALHSSVSFWHTISSGVISSVLPLLLCLLIALGLTIYRKLTPLVHEYRSNWAKREADRMMDASRLSDVARVIAQLSHAHGQADAHELRDIATGSGAPGTVVV